MVKKQDDTSGSKSGLFDSELAATVKDSAQQIWLAGLGAFSKAQEEGSKVFETLVKEGTGLQRKTQAAAEEKLSEVAGKVSHMAGEATAKVGERWDKLEGLFEDRVSRAMNKLGVPAAKDLHAMMDRIDALSAKIDALAKAKTSAAKSAAKTAAKKTARPAAKRAPRKTSL